MGQFLQYWYLQSPGWVFARFLQTLTILDGHMAVADTFRNLSKPIFQDYSYQGRIIGFFFRIFRIFFSLIFYLLVAGVYLMAYLIWLILPLICLASLVGAFMATS